MHIRRSRQVRALTALAVAALLGPSATPAQARPGAVPAPAGRPASTPHVPERDRAAVLGPGWRGSTDRAVVGSGDADGFHLLVADAAQGYGWSTLATLSEPGLDTDRWIGNVCVTGSGRSAVVVYAPRTFTNRADLFDRGGFTAVVDLHSGAVRKLPVTSSLAYFNPGCGAGEKAVLTQAGGDELDRTRLIEVDTVTSALGTPVEVPGELTSPVPTAGGIVAADAGAVVRVDGAGRRRVLTAATGVPFRLAADADGGVVFMERAGTDRVLVRRAPTRAVTTGRAVAATLATGRLTDLNVTSGRGGRVFVAGVGKLDRGLRADTGVPGVSLVDVPAGAQLSLSGELAITSVLPAGTASAEAGSAGQVKLTPEMDSTRPGHAPGRQPLTIAATSLTTGRAASFLVSAQEPAAGRTADGGRQLSPAVRTSASPATRRLAGDPNDPGALAERVCAVARNDPANQAVQPRPRQVEWAVDQAVRHALTVQRPANWKNLGMPAYTPQGLFPPVSLVGGGYVPAQVMLGVAAQESNLWQAPRFVVPGVTANPLIGNYFGVDIYNSDESDDWTINWSEADCGYGVTQVTDGMRLAGRERPGETALPYQKQRAVALDFAANIAAGLQILQQKWNQVRSAGMTLNNGDPAKLENWFYAVWAYNSGFYPDRGDGSPWGLGWANNPANPRYPANRTAFLDVSYADAAHPQHWPYPEKIMGWAGHPVEVLDAPNTLVAGFRPAWWNGTATTAPQNRSAVKPPVNQFCNASNQCQPGQAYPPDAPDVIGEPAGPCAHRDSAGRIDLRCWYHQSSTWKWDCSYSCGNELLRFDPGYAYQEDGTAYPPTCTLDGLPANARIVDDVPDGTPAVRPNCGRPWNNAGTFSLTFPADAAGQYPGKIDTHQLGGGFGGHFWFTHTRTADDEDGKLAVTAKWRLSTSHNGPMRIMVALPDHGAHTAQARYTIRTAQGNRTRTLKQQGSANRWVPLGTYLFNGVPEVTLSSVTPDGDGSDNIAFDAVAFVPVSGTYREESIEAVAVFDENQNVDVSAPASWISGPMAGQQALYDWALHRSGDLLALPICSTPPLGQCVTTQLRQFAQRWRDEVLAAGTDPVNHPPGNSVGRWLGIAQPYTDRPTSSQRPAHFDDDDRIKNRVKATVSFVVGPDGFVIPGSESATYEHRTGNTHLPRFVRDLFESMRHSFGIQPPNLQYTLPDLNAHDGGLTTANPAVDGKLPGRAYAFAGRAPALVDATGARSDAQATCVVALTVGGGSIGYRPMLGTSGPPTAMADWVGQINAHPVAAQSVRDLADDIRRLFFDAGLAPGADASSFVHAPPIWQELHFKACANGTMQRIENLPLLRSSWMPDQYLYRNGSAINHDGQASASSLPVTRGDFQMFSKLPDLPGNPWSPSPFGQCTELTGQSGNPWDMSPFPSLEQPIPAPPAANPDRAHFCLNTTLPSDPGHSSYGG
ncbi:hypothetical protein [Micromonospora sp. NPDC049171]|uniref:golvesin C-terminal-like domain-containing protein n=1 Tax=Micromonospora sp. NPDC049171 TaxID=3155770 RepID=UPI00340053FA